MKQNKGEAAFASVDEVLAEKIVANSKDHGEKAPEEAPAPSGQVPREHPTPKKKDRCPGWWIAVAVIAVMAAAVGCLFFGKCNLYYRKYLKNCCF
jgi:hypothetical protein